ncbi:MAG: hypothetical protein WAK56_13285 [Candidatus Sulfotelmatobacter sp.]
MAKRKRTGGQRLVSFYPAKTKFDQREPARALSMAWGLAALVMW